MAHFINHNGRLLEEDVPVINAANRGLRYGDGVFETMRLTNGQVQLSELHFERLFQALDLLQFRITPNFSMKYLTEQILFLCTKNRLLASARIRLNVFRKDGGLYDLVDHTPDFVIEAWDLVEGHLLNESGLVIDVHSLARKSCDVFSNLKSNNYLPYTIAALYAKQNKLDDCLILNTNERVCDATIANVFCIRDNVIYTPPLSEGCVAGVMRRHLLQILPQKGYSVEEKPLAIGDLHDADELFLTNAISGIRWVETFQNKLYTNTFSRSIFSLIF